MLDEAGTLYSLIDDMIYNSLMQLNVGFFARIVSLGNAECETATVQPLHKFKAVNKEPQTRSVLANIPVLYNARYRLIEEERDCLIDGNAGCTCSVTMDFSGQADEDKNVSGSASGSGTVDCSCTIEKRKHLKKEWIKPGDIAFCVCADRDISQTRGGSEALPKPGEHHAIKDAVVVGVL